MSDDFRTHIAKLRREHAARKARQVQAGDVLRVAKLIAVGEAPHDHFLMLHPSTVIPDGWQVSMFDRRGPYSHTDAPDQAQAIRQALEDFDVTHMRPVTEAEFMAITATDEFRRGVDQVVFAGLEGRLAYEFGWTDKVLAVCKAAREAADYDEGIAILRAGLAELRGKKNPSPTINWKHDEPLAAAPDGFKTVREWVPLQSLQPGQVFSDGQATVEEYVERAAREILSGAPVVPLKARATYIAGVPVYSVRDGHHRLEALRKKLGYDGPALVDVWYEA